MKFFLDLNFLLEELINPEKELPRIVLCSLITVTISYLLANMAYFSVLDIGLIKSSKSIGKFEYVCLCVCMYMYF
jgi:amino acid transporter